MEHNPLLTKIQELLDERNWSLYKLAQLSDIKYSSLSSLFAKNHQPTVATLEKICTGFHITLSEFFEEKSPYRCDTPNITDEELSLLNSFRSLSKKDKSKCIDIIEILKK